MEINLLDCFEATVLRQSDKTAVKHKEEEITFGELKARAEKLGIILVELISGRKNCPIGVFLPKEINTVIADLGIMYSSNFFMNLDVNTPKERITNIFATVKPEVVVTSEKYSKVIQDTSVPIVFIDKQNWDMETANVDKLLERRKGIIDTDPFCLINTSGSTGTPKGVVLSYRSFFDFMAVSNERFGFDGTEVIGSLSPVVFDIFDFELCMLMLNGSKLILLDAFLASFPARLLENMVKEKVSFIFWVPSIMVNIANMRLLEKIQLPEL